MALDGDIETPGRIVGRQDAGFEQQGEAEQHPLAHTAAELVGQRCQDPVGIGDAQVEEGGAGPVPDGGPPLRPPPALAGQHRTYILEVAPHPDDRVQCLPSGSGYEQQPSPSHDQPLGRVESGRFEAVDRQPAADPGRRGPHADQSTEEKRLARLPLPDEGVGEARGQIEGDLV